MGMSLEPNQKKAVRLAIVDYCKRAEAHQIVWNYSQQRPFHGFGIAPERHHVNDCSGYISLAFNWAMHECHVYMPDPLDERYSGYGNTTSCYEYLRRYKAPADKYLVGDIALFAVGTLHAHVVICRVKGTRETSVWSSNGSESAPNKVKLGYRRDLTGVFRHPSLR